MKQVLTERNKHRLVGVLVLLSAAVIFLPVMMKNSNQHFEENINVSLKLPAKPVAPRVAIPNQRIMFKSVKVAHVQIPTSHLIKPTSLIAKAQPLTLPPIVEKKSMVASVPVKSITPVAKAIKTALAEKKPTVLNKVHGAEKQLFAIQIGVFTRQNNADVLVKSLRNKGYAASYNVKKTADGSLYQVVVGQLNQRKQALDLQKKIASNMQLNGLIVRTGVS